MGGSSPGASIDLEAVARAAEVLRGGGLVAFPTETVYGLGADALREESVRRVYELKGRPSHNPMIVHVVDEAMARRVVAEWPERARVLAGRFWPGPLTMVLGKSPALPDVVTAGQGTVGVRCPDHPLALALIEAFGGPIVGPSANPSGFVSPTRASHVRDGFGDAGLMVLDGGSCRAGIESTVLSLVQDPPRILRPGAVSREDLGEDVEGSGAAGVVEPGLLMSPGRLRSHYAPLAAARLFEGEAWPGVLEGVPARTVVLAHEAARACVGSVRVIPLPAEAEAYAAHLYTALREADALGAELILIERPVGRGGLWVAIHDRLERATAGREG